MDHHPVAVVADEVGDHVVAAARRHVEAVGSRTAGQGVVTEPAGQHGLLEIRQEYPVSPHQLVVDTHQLAVHLARRLVNADRVA